MTRLGLIASSALIAAATAAQSAPLTFQASASNSSLALTCGPSAQSCTRLKAKIDIDSGSATATLAPGFNFDFIEFDGIKPTKPKRNTPKTPDQQKEFASSFGISAKLAFRILGVTGLYNVIATGRGNFEVEDDEVTFLSLLWDKVPDVTIPGVGTFAFSFDNLGNRTPLLRRTSSANTNEDSDDSNEENDEDLILTVDAQVENISVVPLPGGAVLLLSALGIIGVGAARRRRAAA